MHLKASSNTFSFKLQQEYLKISNILFRTEKNDNFKGMC